MTLVVETDRHAGSLALESWLAGLDDRRSFSWGLCETVDLPVPAPALFRGATGHIVLAIELTSDQTFVEGQYAGVSRDSGHRLAVALAALKTADGEVLVPGFYDGVAVPADPELTALRDLAPTIAAWIQVQRPPEERQFSALHLTMGTFLTPALTVSSIANNVRSPWLSTGGRATLDIRVMPGQDARSIALSVATFIQHHLPEATCTIELLRESTPGTPLPALRSDGPQLQSSLPVAPGDSPAGMLAKTGLPTTGFSSVWADPQADQEQIRFDAIMRGSALLDAIRARISDQLARDPR